MTPDERKAMESVWELAEDKAPQICEILNKAGYVSDQETVLALLLICADVTQQNEADPVSRETFINTCEVAWDLRDKVSELARLAPQGNA